MIFDRIAKLDWSTICVALSFLAVAGAVPWRCLGSPLAGRRHVILTEVLQQARRACRDARNSTTAAAGPVVGPVAGNAEIQA